MTTHGPPTSAAAWRSTSSVAAAGTTRKAGWATWAAAQRRRWTALSEAAITASTGLCGRPIRAATAAARISIGVSAATTAATDPALATIRPALRSGSPGLTGSTGRPPSGSAPSLPTTRSSSSRPAAVTKSAAR